MQFALENNTLRDFTRLFIFSDCQNAIDLTLDRTTVAHSFEIIELIHDRLTRLREVVTVAVLYVPAHVGVPGNEAANTAAQNAANSVVATEPVRGQPLVPLATSNALIRGALKERRQLTWLSTVAEKSGMQHLSRLRVDVSKPTAFFVGTRRQQTVLARLRFGTCGLNASRSRWYAGVNEECVCGQTETVRHFLLECELYNIARRDMIAAIRTVWNGVITEDVLLGGSGVPMLAEAWKTVVAAVANFVFNTRRVV